MAFGDDAQNEAAVKAEEARIAKKKQVHRYPERPTVTNGTWFANDNPEFDIITGEQIEYRDESVNAQGSSIKVKATKNYGHREFGKPQGVTWKVRDTLASGVSRPIQVLGPHTSNIKRGTFHPHCTTWVCFRICASTNDSIALRVEFHAFQGRISNRFRFPEHYRN